MYQSRNPLFTLNYRAKIILSALAALLISFIVLDRWLVTDLGLMSYGRVWPYYINYADFGFIRRALVGTIFSVTGFNSLLKNEYLFAYVIHHIAIIVLTIIVASCLIREKINDWIFVSSILLSPALIIHSGYTTGTLDIFVLIFSAINILFVRNVAVFSVMLIVGTLTHELFVFTVPAQFLALVLRRQKAALSSMDYCALFLSVALFFAALILVFVWGRVDIDRSLFEAIMQSHLPIAAHKHDLWSGYPEVGRSLEEQRQTLDWVWSTVSANLYYLLIPVTYLALATLRAALQTGNRIFKWGIVCASLAPLFAYLVATDLYRWLAMSANMALLLTLAANTNSTSRTPPWLNKVVLLFTLFAPFGAAAIDRPFPMHQFLLEKLFY